MASPLETLFMMFEADTSKLDKSIDDSYDGADKLEKKLGAVDKAAGVLGSSLVELVKGFGAGLVAGLAATSIANLVTNTAELTLRSLDAAEALGVSVTELEALDSAAQMTGGQTGAFTQSLTNMSRNLNEVAATGKGAALPVMEQLGISMKDLQAVAKDPIASMEMLADKFVELSETQAAQVGQKLGLDQGTINLLRQGRTGIAALTAEQKKLFTLTQQDAEAAAKFQDELDRLMRIADGLKRSLATALMPALTWVFEKLQKLVLFMKDNQTAVVAFFAAVAAILFAVFLPAVLSAVTAVYTLLAPFILVGLAIAAIAAIAALVFDDINAYLNGQDSVIGELAKKWPIIGLAVRELGLVFEWFKEVVASVFGFIVDLITVGPAEAFENLKQRIFGVMDSIAARFPPLAGLINFVKFNVELTQKAFGYLWEAVQAGARVAITWLTKMWETMGPIIKGAAKLMGIDLGNLSFDFDKGMQVAARDQDNAMEVMRKNREKREGKEASESDGGGGVMSTLSDAAAPAKKAGGGVNLGSFDLGSKQLSAIDSASSGSGAIKSANGNPFGQGGGGGGVSSGGKGETVVQKTYTVTVENVTVETQATDAEGIASSVGGALTSEINRAINAADNGMKA